MGGKQLENLSIYIHVPFCKKKCYYCDFSSYSGKENLIKEYIIALKEEIILYAEEIEKYNIQTIFLGGGTPSVLKSSQIEEIMDCIKENYNISKTAEISIELNPESMDIDKLKTYYNTGINRLSIGLQACQDHLLKKLGRLHNYEDYLKNLKCARDVGFTNISTDLMFALPGQKIEDWYETLENIINLEIPHISTYSLIIEEGTLFYQWEKSGNISRLTEDLELRMYHDAIKYLKSKNYTHYEISNFAKPGFQSKHNKIYWQNLNYIGLGSGAHSYFKDQRFNNFVDIETYIHHINLNKKPIENIIDISRKDEISETMFLGLRMMEGISIDKFQKRFNESPFDIYEKQFLDLKKKGLLSWDEKHIYLTKKGIDLANIVFQEMLLD